MFDTHVHFDSLATDTDLRPIVERARAAGVAHMIAVGGSPAANTFALSAAEQFPESIRAALGYDRNCASTPHFSECNMQNAVSQHPNLVAAIGEIGLDFHYLPDTAPKQESLFGEMLNLAASLPLPVIVHSRQAEEATISLLSEHAETWKGGADQIGVLHCFTGSEAFARRVLDLGLYISLSGIITFQNAEELRKVAKFVPANRLLIETDAPYLTPAPHRGKQNEPAFLPFIAQKLAEIRKCTVEEIAELTTQNAERLFGLNL